MDIPRPEWSVLPRPRYPTGPTLPVYRLANTLSKPLPPRGMAVTAAAELPSFTTAACSAPHHGTLDSGQI